MSRRLLFLAIATAGFLAAQDPPTRVGRLSFITGAVSFQPGGVTEWTPATINRPLTVGDQLWADDGARAEVHLPGSAFRLGSKTAFQFLNLDDQSVQVRLSEGTVDVRVRRVQGQNMEVDTPNLAFTIHGQGDYRVDTNPDTFETYVTVRAGEGEVTANGGTFAVHAGDQAVVTGQDGSQYNLYAAPATDEFDNWVVSRDRRDEVSQSSRYVSPDVVGAEDLDQYGDWRSSPDYGQVWVPRGVEAGWAPYHNGHWAWVDPWGWTWVDDAPWGFAPFHYGRWAYTGGYWGWVPGPLRAAPVYAPALVAWVGFGGGGAGVSLNFGGGGGVGWFPLGPRDVFIPSYHVSEGYVNRVNVSNTTVINTTNITNVYNNYTRTGQVTNVTYMNRAVPGAVIAVPRNALTNASRVQSVSVRVQPNQISGMRAAEAAPRVAPQRASLLGRPASGGANAPHPPAAVMSAQVVAKATPPPPLPSFQQRQTLLAKDPGHPISIAQQRQMAPAAAARPAARVVTQARPVTPQVSRAAAPRPAAAALSARPGTPPPAANVSRPGQPQAAVPAQAQHPQTQPSRTFEPPAARPAQQGRPAEAQPSRSEASHPPSRPAETQTARPPASAAQPSRTFEPPAAARPAQQARPAEAQPSRSEASHPPSRPAETQTARPPAPAAQPKRTFEPPAAQRTPPAASHSVETPREQPRTEPRTYQPPQSEHRAEPQSQPKPQAARPAEPQPHRAEPPAEHKPAPEPKPRDEKKKPEE